MTTTDFAHTHAGAGYAATDRTAGVARRPLFEPIDFAAMVAAIIMALGPLTAYAVGF